MSKYVKELLTTAIKDRLGDASDLLLVNVIGMEANANTTLRRELRSKNIQMTVVKNSLAKRATEGSPLAAAFEGLEGSVAVVWGGEDIVSLAKEVVRLAGDAQFGPFEPRGGIMDGQTLSPEQIGEVSKWPTRTEQLSMLVGQVLGPGSTLAAQVKGPGAKLASQIKQVGEGDDD